MQYPTLPHPVVASAPAHLGVPPFPEGDVVLVDGSTVRLRPLRATEGDQLVAFFNALSAETRQQRFLSALSELKGSLLQQLLDVDQITAIAIVAERNGEIVGVGRAHTTGDSTPSRPTAEVAFTVLDSLQGLGIGTLLLEFLASRARSVGFTHFEAVTRTNNDAMLGVFRRAGFDARIRRDPGDVSLAIVEFSITETEGSQQARQARGRIAAAASLRPLLRPESIAVIGASATAGTPGAELVRQLLVHGFTGPIYPVNPHAEYIESLPAVPSVKDIPVPVDLAIIAVPSSHVLGVARECAEAGVRGLLVISAGFAETGPEGRALQDQLLAEVRASGMRLIGPNCLGVVTTDPATSMHAVFTNLDASPGSIALMSQSGAVAMALAATAHDRNVGLSAIVSVGNKADVSGNDLLEYWEQDESTSVISLYLESFGNPRKFARIARSVSGTKPIVAIKAARSAAGSKAAASHTGALAVEDSTVDALFEHTGVLRVDEPGELLSVAHALATLPLPNGRRVAVIGNAGGLGILAADAIVRNGLEMAELSAATVTSLQKTAPANASLRNPLDLTAGTSTATFASSLKSVLADPGVDAVIVVLVTLRASDLVEFQEVLAVAIETSDKPIVSVFADRQARPTATQALVPALTTGNTSDTANASVPAAAERTSVPSAASTSEAALVVARLVQRSEWLARFQPPDRPLDAAALQTIRALLDTELELRPEGGPLDEVIAFRLVEAAGIPVKMPVRAEDEDSAVRAARTLGFPVCLKAADPNLQHKSDVGAVRLGLSDEFHVAAAYVGIEKSLHGHVPGVLVQAMSAPGVEMILGVQNNPHFGPLVVLGAGGRTAELWKDTAVRLAPLHHETANEMVRSLRSYPLLNGFRGANPADVASFVDCVVRLAHLAAEFPEIADVTLNPVMVHAHGVSAVDVKVALAPPSTIDGTDLRLLK